MAFEGMNLATLTEADLQMLLGQQESRILDFKQATYGNADADKKELLGDISSFANTLGGHIVIGVEEDAGAATSITGIECNADHERQRLEQIARTGLQPRIPDLHIHSIALTSGRFVIIIVLSQSWLAPHRVIFQGKNSFHARAGAGKYEPDVEELRSLFLKSFSTSERLREFHHQRVAKVRAHITPIPFTEEKFVIFHLLPYSALSSLNKLAMSALSESWNYFFPDIAVGGLSYRLNLDGLVAYTGRPPHEFYTQIWRNGTVETVYNIYINTMQNGQPSAHLSNIEPTLIGSVYKQLSALQRVGIQPPFVLIATMVGMKSVTLLNQPHQGMREREARTFDSDVITLPETLITSFPVNKQETATMLRDICDSINHAAGYPQSPRFNAEGVWNEN